jgi:hypothetical protein
MENETNVPSDSNNTATALIVAGVALVGGLVAETVRRVRKSRKDKFTLDPIADTAE